MYNRAMFDAISRLLHLKKAQDRRFQYQLVVDVSRTRDNIYLEIDWLENAQPQSMAIEFSQHEARQLIERLEGLLDQDLQSAA